MKHTSDAAVADENGRGWDFFTRFLRNLQNHLLSETWAEKIKSG
jgi:hypothetical protein